MAKTDSFKVALSFKQLMVATICVYSAPLRISRLMVLLLKAVLKSPLHVGASLPQLLCFVCYHDNTVVEHECLHTNEHCCS